MDPVILFFLFGLVAGLLRSELKLPSALYDSLSIFLLLAIGLKGGQGLLTGTAQGPETPQAEEQRVDEPLAGLARQVGVGLLRWRGQLEQGTLGKGLQHLQLRGARDHQASRF